MKKTTLIALSLAVLLAIGFLGLYVEDASAFAGAGADCNGDGVDDVTCSGSGYCWAGDNLGCFCRNANGETVSNKSCPEE